MQRSLKTASAVIVGTVALASLVACSGSSPKPSQSGSSADAGSSAGSSSVEEAPAAPNAAQGPSVVFASGSDFSTIPSCIVGTWVMDDANLTATQMGAEDATDITGYLTVAFDGSTQVLQNHYSFTVKLGVNSIDYMADWDGRFSYSVSEGDQGSGILAATPLYSSGTATVGGDEIALSDLEGARDKAVIESSDATSLMMTAPWVIHGVFTRLG